MTSEKALKTHSKNLKIFQKFENSSVMELVSASTQFHISYFLHCLSPILQVVHFNPLLSMMKPSFSSRMLPVRHCIVEPNDPSSSIVAAAAAAAATATAFLHSSTSDSTATAISTHNTDIMAITEGVLKAFTAVTAGLSLTYYALRSVFSVGLVIASHLIDMIRPAAQWVLSHMYQLFLKKPMYCLSSLLNWIYPMMMFCTAASICGVVIGSCAGFVAEAVSSILISATWGSDTAEKVIREDRKGAGAEEEMVHKGSSYLYEEEEEEETDEDEFESDEKGGLKIVTGVDTTDDDGDSHSIIGSRVPFTTSAYARPTGVGGGRTKDAQETYDDQDREGRERYSHDRPPRARPSTLRKLESENSNDSSTTTSSNVSGSIQGFLKRRVGHPKKRSPSPPPFLMSRQMPLSTTVPHSIKQQQKSKPLG
ncbi:hypothetical protein BDF20DRAFT_835864 [Mycotypha africana]|uniref:uncharacterized protein n=1 Tax=Mycotypha africana TaxID=64632 RepID=UPI002300092C|nr:uncharacterized protein BDF20DRAFT_835864 [Mycotypha africana]KAI8977029.1 hypothetical protein BDF20DRAFT_835864 [Mycotypha africana]